MTFPRIGIYEKAFSSELSWEERLTLAASHQFDFMELAIDASAERLGRLDWSSSERSALRRAIENSGLPIFNIVLSAHRLFPLGSASIAIRKQSLDILKKAIDFAVDIGVRIIQIAGYYVFEEPHRPESRDLFMAGLQQGTLWAGQAGVMLGLENMDGEDILSIEDAMDVLQTVNSPWLQLYPDVGNLSANKFDVCAQLTRGKGHIVGIHLKDTTPGSFRRIPFGQGTVPFAEVFRLLSEMEYVGPVTLEMWNDDSPDADQTTGAAKQWIQAQMKINDFTLANR